MSQLSGARAARLRDALLDNFLPGALDELLFYGLEIRREQVTTADNYRTRVFALIRDAESCGWTDRLISAARDARPDNAGLQALAAGIGLTSAPPGPALERMISESVPFVDVSVWREQLGRLEGQVCRVEIPAGLDAAVGTGLLVSPDLCLTNYHVIQPLMDEKARPEHVRLRFDFRRASDGTSVSDGTTFKLAAPDWLVASSQPSAVDLQPEPAGLPGADELDFALLRVDGRPGDEPAGLARKLTDAPPRGWIDRVGSAGFDAGNRLFVLQHPEGAPLKLTFGASLGLNANGTRLRHQVNTEPGSSGSSGSACLNARLELVGLHQAGDPNFADPAGFNSAVPVSAILRFLAGQPVHGELFSRP